LILVQASLWALVTHPMHQLMAAQPDFFWVQTFLGICFLVPFSKKGVTACCKCGVSYLLEAASVVVALRAAS